MSENTVLEEEKDLVERAKNRDPEAFTTLYRKHYQQIYAYVYKRVANRQMAEDITADTFFNVVKKLHTFEWRDVPFSAWLYRIAINELARYMSKQKKGFVAVEVTTELDEVGFWGVEESGPQDQIIEQEKLDEQKHNYVLIQQGIAKLPIKYQEVLTLKYFEGKKISEICQILGKKEGTVKSLLSRGVDQLTDVVSGQVQPNSASKVIYNEG